jgi:ribose transport system ATP-binding protein
LSVPVVELREVSKRFGPTVALERVSLALRPGEVHALAGENGAGKSTLIKVLCGVHGDFTGELRLDGHARRFERPSDARRAGIGVIHQELSLVDALSVSDNLALGGGGWWRDPRRDEVAARAALERVGLSLDPQAVVASLPLATRQRVEIARALALQARVLVMDEPTSALGEADSARLLDIVEQLRDDGCAVLYISHRLDELERIADRFTVLRDGRSVATGRRHELDRESLVTAMLGRALGAVEHGAIDAADKRRAPQAQRRRSAVRNDAPLLRVEDLSLGAGAGGRPQLDGVSLELQAGEVLGIAGLHGCGATRLLFALFGALDQPLGGRITLAGRRYRPRQPRDALAQGVALLSGDRDESVLRDESVIHNASLSSLSRLSRAGLIDRRRERREVESATEPLHLRAPSLDTPLRALSGGNQQKVALARCLMARPRLLLLADPLRGVDVGAKAEVLTLLRALAEGGTGMLLVSSELDEIVALCDRALVMARGRVVDVLQPPHVERAAMLRAAMGGTAQRGTAQRGTAQRGTAQRGTAQRGTAQRGTAQRGTAQGGTAQRGTAQGGTAQGSGSGPP